jgi:hypothetical protein
MQGLVDGRDEHLDVVAAVLVAGNGADRGVVIIVGMDAPEPIGQGSQILGQVPIGCRRVCPDRVAAKERDRYCAQDRGLRVCVNEGYVGMPMVRPAAAARSVEFEGRCRTGPRRDSRMADDPAE